MARKTKEEKEADKLDNEINKAWTRLCFGVEVSIMDIPKIFRECAAAVKAGSTVDAAVEAARDKHRLNKNIIPTSAVPTEVQHVV